LLAALPKAWPEGSVRGVRARGGVEVDLDWAQGRLQRLQVRGQPGQKLKIRSADRLTDITLDAKGRATMLG
jgi:alpha-L-fucosidase 2